MEAAPSAVLEPPAAAAAQPGRRAIGKAKRDKLYNAPDIATGKPIDPDRTGAIRGRAILYADRVFWARVVPLATKKARAGDWDAARFLMQVLRSPLVRNGRVVGGARAGARAKAGAPSAVEASKAVEPPALPMAGVEGPTGGTSPASNPVQDNASRLPKETT
jgi:hypothetical protein